MVLISDFTAHHFKSFIYIPFEAKQAWKVSILVSWQLIAEFSSPAAQVNGKITIEPHAGAIKSGERKFVFGGLSSKTRRATMDKMQYKQHEARTFMEQLGAFD